MNVPITRAPIGQNERQGLPSNWGGAQPTGPQEEAVDIRGLLLPIWRRKWLVALVTLVSLVLGVIAAEYLEPHFTASARVIFDPERLKIIDLDNVVVSPDISTTGLQNQIEILRSTTLLERVAEILRLEATPEFNPALRVATPSVVERAVTRLPLPGRVRSVLAEIGVIAPQVQSFAADETARRLRSATLRSLIENMELRPIPNSRVIEISYSSIDPNMASAIVNAVAEQYIVVQTEVKRNEIASATELLGVRVQDLENRLNSAEESVEVARLELASASGYASDLTSGQLEVLNASLSEARGTLLDLERRHARLIDALESDSDFGSVTEFRESGVIGNLRTREGVLRDEEAGLRALLGPSGSPSLKRVEAQLVEVRENMRAEAENIVASVASDLDLAREAEAKLAAELQALESTALEQSRAELRVQRLEREAAASREIYESFLNRMKETSEQSQMQTSDARFLTRASPPEFPDSTSRLRLVSLAGLAGLISGMGIVFLLERLNNAFRNPTDLEARTGLSVLAAIPHAGSRRRPKQLVAHLIKKPNSSLAESIRNLRTSILYSNIDQPPRVVMFSSSVPSEGKTTTAMLVAITSQQMGRSAIIVDCDFRRRTLGAMFATKSGRPGLLAVLAGASSVAAAVLTEPESGLHVLAPESSAHSQGNPADILSSLRFRRLIDELKLRYDLVILDTPPALVVTDARLVAQLADAVVYLVRWDHTRRGAVLEGLRELASVKAKIAGVAFSLVNESRAAKFVDNEYYYKRRYKKYLSS